MSIIYGPLNPPAAATYSGNDGDIFVRNSGVNPQWRFSTQPAPVWTPIVPPAPGTPRTVASDTRADVVPRAGVPNDRLAKLGIASRAWEVGWVNAASGVVAAAVDHPSATVWDITHDLGVRWVDVTVVSPGNADPTAEQKIIFPKIDYISEMACRLTFAESVAGTAVARR